LGCDQVKIGIICGHQINDLFDEREELAITTPFGSVIFESGTIGNHQVFFINRHGKESNLPPHKIKYKANIEAFHQAHVDCVFSVGTVGSMNTNIAPGDFVVPHDFFDVTKQRSLSFFDDKRVHVDMTDPFCPSLRTKLIETAEINSDITLHRNGVYVTTEGPRLESASEIRFYATVGEIVGMTLVPEVVLAREKGLCFVSLCMVCNMAAGLQKNLPVDEIRQVYAEKEKYLSQILKDTISNLANPSDCECKRKQKDALL
jgi:5'-methylthioadenosine phosphorylase